MFDSVRKIIETRLLKDGSVNRSISFPIFLEGRVIVQPNGGSWGILIIEDSNNIGTEFGSISSLKSGSIRLKLFFPHGTGTKGIRDMADELDYFMKYTSGDDNTGVGGTLFIKNGSLRRVSDNVDGYLNYNLDYIYDYYTN
jgi:hypothetical protein